MIYKKIINRILTLFNITSLKEKISDKRRSTHVGLGISSIGLIEMFFTEHIW